MQLSQPFSELIRGGGIDWDFFNSCTGCAEVTFERGVYKSLQKVCDMFSAVAAAKMQLGGKFYKRMTFKVDPGLFRALREDRELAGHLSSAMDKFVGEPV